MGRPFSLAMYDGALPPAERDALLQRFVAQDIAGANLLLAQRPAGRPAILVNIVENARAAEAAPVWRSDEPGRFRFRFHAKTWLQHPAIIFGRWLDLLPLIDAVAVDVPRGSCLLNLGDEGHRPGLAFDAATDDFVLIPDYAFVKTRGYADLARSFAARALPWEARRPAVLWRGTTTGHADTLAALPRVRLCRTALALGAAADVGLVGAVQRFAGADGWLRAEGLWRGFVPPTDYDTYQLHLDIDGNSSSWGLLAKLHSGGAVLKVASPGGHRQWYYDRLQPWTHYVPVRADLADLTDLVTMLLADPTVAERIGTAGQRLARELGYPAEIARAVPRIRRAFIL